MSEDKKQVFFLENDNEKRYVSENCKYYFNKKNGLMITCGKTIDDDPVYSKNGPFILDLEISTVCPQKCSWCYKSNTENGENMDFGTFRKILHKVINAMVVVEFDNGEVLRLDPDYALLNVSSDVINRAEHLVNFKDLDICVNDKQLKMVSAKKVAGNPLLTQTAFGIGSLDGNPHIWEIMDYTRNNGYTTIIPNITINGNGLTNEYADRLVNICGAVAVSRYDSDVCYNAVKKLTDRGLNQVNIHQLLCEETFESCQQVINDSKNDERLKGLNAIVFLLLKPKGKRNRHHRISSLSKYKGLINYAFEKDARIGFDSCGCESFLMAVSDRKDYKNLEVLSEPCESTLFSAYINVNGNFYPCSFAEDNNEFFPKDGISVLECSNFIEDVWYNDRTVEFRDKLLQTTRCSPIGCRSCPIYDLKML